MSWIIKAEDGAVQAWFDNLVRTVENERGTIISSLSTMMADINTQASEFLKTAETPKKRAATLEYIVANINGVLNKSFSGAAFTNEIERVIVTEDVADHLKAEVEYLDKGEQE